MLVIGLGPGGGAAAAAAARGGLRVLAIEKRKEIGAPVQCAEFIPLPIGKYATGEGVLCQHVAAMASHLPSGAVAQTDFPGLMVDRAAFDQALAREARAAGAEIRTDTRLTALDAAQFCAELRSAEGATTVRYRVLIAADGPRSTVARLLGLPALETVETRQYTVPLQVPSDRTDIWLSEAYPGGYAWLFPKGSLANLGLGADPRFARDLKGPLDALHRLLVDQGRVGTEILYRTGGAIPVGGLRERLAVANVMFVGDAAGLTHPVTGAGIAPAVVSGERAGQAAAALLSGKDADALAEFEADIRDQYEASLTRAVERRRRLTGYWRTPEAMGDAPHRRGWIAFPEYFENERAIAW